MFTIGFQNRSTFANLAQPAGVRLAVERLSWRAVGGPWSARIRADAASAMGLWQLPALLRCGVSVTDALGLAWWGYLAEVEIHTGELIVTVSLAEMANHIAVGRGGGADRIRQRRGQRAGVRDAAAGLRPGPAGQPA